MGSQDNDWHGVYELLLQRHGPQGWWPVTPRNRSRPSYHPGQWLALTARQRAEILFGAILTQNTAWRNVEKALLRLHKEGIFLPEQLIRIPQEDLAEWIRPSGYYRQKADRLVEVCESLLEAGGMAALEKLPLEEARPLLLSWRGIGEETADSVLLYALDKATFVVDAYTRRLAFRLGRAPEGASTGVLQRQIVPELPRSLPVYGELHALIVAHAKSHCAKRNPACMECPLRQICLWGKGRKQD